jgi:hypothetical protein
MPHEGTKTAFVTDGGWAHFLIGNKTGVPAEYNQKLVIVRTLTGNPWFYVREGAMPTLSVSGVNRAQYLRAGNGKHTFVVNAGSLAYVSVYAPCCTNVEATIEIWYAKNYQRTCRDRRMDNGQKWLDLHGMSCEMYGPRRCELADKWRDNGYDADSLVSCVCMFICVNIRMYMYVCIYIRM